MARWVDLNPLAGGPALAAGRRWLVRTAMVGGHVDGASRGGAVTHVRPGYQACTSMSLSAVLSVPPQRASRGWSRVGARWPCTVCRWFQQLPHPLFYAALAGRASPVRHRVTAEKPGSNEQDLPDRS